MSTTTKEHPVPGPALTLQYMADWVAEHEADFAGVSLDTTFHRIYVRDVAALRRLFPGAAAKRELQGGCEWYTVLQGGVEFVAHERLESSEATEVRL